MPKQLNNGRITLALQKVFGFKGRYIPMLDEVIVPVYQIEDPLPSEPFRLGIATQELPEAQGTIGNVNQINFTNPAGSGVNIVLTHVSVGSFNKAQLGPGGVVVQGVFVRTGAILSGAQTFGKIYRDRRISGTPVAIISADGDAAPFGDSSIFAMLIVRTDEIGAGLVGSSQVAPRQPLLMLDPGGGFAVQLRGPGAVAPNGAELLVNYAWLEIPISQPPEGGTPP